MPWRAVLRVVLAVAGPSIVAALLLPAREDLSHSVVAFALLVPVVVVAWVGGLVAGAVGAAVGAALFNLGFLPPYGTFSLERAEYVVVFVGFLAVAVTISALVGRARDRAAAAEAGESEVRVLLAVSRELAWAPGRPDGIAGAARSVAARLGFGDGRLLGPDEEPEADELALPLRTGDEQQGTLALRGTPVPFGEREERIVTAVADQFAVAVQADRAERSLRTSEIGRRTEDLRRALVAAASHELKSPIAAITASVTDLLERGERAGPAEVHDVLADIRASTSRLEHVVANLLDMSRIEAGTLTARDEAVDLAECAETAAAGVVRRWPGAQVRTDIADGAAFVRGDPVFVERIVTNLVENAVRASRAAGDGAVDVVARDHGEQIVLAVRDHGPGFGAGDRARLFTPFYDLEERAPGLGAGLGLAICKGFAEAMGGSIAASETPGGGATVVVRLPKGRR